jgi:hypothetical protein
MTRQKRVFFSFPAATAVIAALFALVGQAGAIGLYRCHGVIEF